MMEHCEEEETGDLGVVRLFKYTSIKEIFNEIVGKSFNSLHVDQNDKKETQVVMVTSAAGGVGKTTIAMGIAANLAMNYKRVLYIYAGRLQCFQCFLKNTVPITEQNVYRILLNSGDDIYGEIKHTFRNEIFDYLPPFKAALISLGLSFDIYHDIILSAKKRNDYDFIVIDTETTFDEGKLKLLDISDKVLVITEQTNSSVVATNEFVSNINFANSEKYFFVCNKFSKNKENKLVSPDNKLKFSINEYIDELFELERNDLNVISKNAGIKKISYIII
jgi:cellulose biosynthesis protein BcsQ